MLNRPETLQSPLLKHYNLLSESFANASGLPVAFFKILLLILQLEYFRGTFVKAENFLLHHPTPAILT